MEGDNNKIRHHKITGKGSVDRPTELICVESIDGHCVEGSKTETWMVVASAEESIVQQVFPGQWATFALIHSTGVKPRTLPMSRASILPLIYHLCWENGSLSHRTHKN